MKYLVNFIYYITIIVHEYSFYKNIEFQSVSSVFQTSFSIFKYECINVYYTHVSVIECNNGYPWDDDSS